MIGDGRELRWTSERAITRALRALGGVGTLGDLIMATGLARVSVAGALEALMSEDRVQVTVSESAVLVYRLHERRSEPRTAETAPTRRSRWRSSPHPRDRDPSGRRRLVPRLSTRPTGRERGRRFDLKTLRLIRARGGVISLAELVEHTGLTVSEADQEARRLVALYGGEPHPSWDGHVVYAFPELVESAHGAFHVREPRPAWVRTEDPMVERHRLGWPIWAAAAAGAVAAGTLAWLSTFPPGLGGRAIVLGAVAGASVGVAFALGVGVLGRLERHPRLLLRRPRTLRRYALGYIFETALKGKGVVSLSRTIEYLEKRTGARRIGRAKVAGVLRRLALEFDAPVTELHDDLFFGFRNVKRQFLASHVQRARLRLERKATGRTVFDSGDTELVAAERELEDFDRELTILARGPAGAEPSPWPASHSSSLYLFKSSTRERDDQREDHSMANNRQKLQNLMQQLEQERDELKVQLGLAKLEAREEWQELEKKMEHLRGRLKVVGEEARETSGDVGAAFDVVAEEVKDGFERLRKLM